ncbi:MAG: invasin domain 3-containing protein [Caldilineaceae bacterium]
MNQPAPCHSTSRMRNLIRLLLSACLLIALLPTPALALSPSKLRQVPPPTPPDGGELKSKDRSQLQTEAAAASIALPGSPLNILVYDDGSLSLKEAGKNHFYSSRASGFFLWIGDDVYGPSVPAGIAHNQYTLLAQTGLLGTGTQSDPWRVTSTLAAGSTGITVVQTVSYANSQRYIDFSWQISGSSQIIKPVTLFHAADLYVDGNDYGTGYLNSTNRAVGGYNVSTGVYGIFTPITPPQAYEESFYSTIWSRIGGTTRGIGFQNRIETAYIDNGAGLQWNLGVLGANSPVTVYSRFSVAPENTSSPALEAQPLDPQVVENHLPLLHEFEFGKQVASTSRDYRSGPFTFEVPISRYYGDYKSGRAYLTVRAFDIDSPNERYTLQINGSSDCDVSGDFRGVNGGWQTMTVSFASRCLNFPTLPANLHDYMTSPIPTTTVLSPASNTFQLVPVTSGRSYKTLIAYALLRIGGSRPVLFGHGVDLGCENGDTRSLSEWGNWIYNQNMPGLGALVDGSYTLGGQAAQWQMSYRELKRVLGLRDKLTPGVAEPDRIIVVGHSMGGLAGRAFVNLEHSRGNYVVEQLVALATPNDGTDLSGIASNMGCAGPARHDLSRDFVRKTFNVENNLVSAWSVWPLIHSGNSAASSHMSSIAARYGIRANDGVVWVDEVQVLPYDTDKVYKWSDDAYSGENISVWCRDVNPGCGLHVMVPSFKSVYDLISTLAGVGKIVEASTTLTSASAPTQLQQVEEPSAATNTTSNQAAISSAVAMERQNLAVMDGTVGANGVDNRTFVVDETTSLALQPTFENGAAQDLALTLIDPYGTRYPADGFAQFVGTPLPGQWTLEVRSGNTGGSYRTLLSTTSDLQLETLPGNDSAQYPVQGETVTLGIRVVDGTAVLTSLAASATVITPDGQPVQVNLNDLGQSGDAIAGDGLYSGAFQTNSSTSAGAYLVSYTVQGARNDNRPFQRVVGSEFTVIAGAGLTDNAVQWSTQDTDGDSLIDVVTAGITLVPPSAGTYEVVGSLLNGYSNAFIGQGAEQVSVLPQQVGLPQLVTMQFGGDMLGSLQTDLYLGLVNLSLSYREDAAGAGTDTVLDYRNGLPGNLALSSPSLQVPLVLVTADTYSLVDNNGNGLADALRFNVGVNPRFGGNYTLQATLQDSSGQSFAFFERGVQLYQGLQTVSIDFSASDLWKNGVAGPFKLANLSLHPVAPENLQAGSIELSDLYVTAPLSLDLFDGIASLTITSNADVSRAYVRISPATPDNIYPVGTSITLSPVIVDPDVVLVRWVVDGVEHRESPLQLTLATNTSISAVFAFPTVTLSVVSGSILADGSSSSQLSILVRNGASIPVPNAQITLATTLGTIAGTVTTGTNGVATTVLRSGTTLGRADVTATYHGSQGQTSVLFVAGPPASIEMGAGPTTLIADGASTSAVVAVVRDSVGHPLPGVQVTFGTNLGTLTSPSVTDVNGAVAITLKAGVMLGTAIVSASAGTVSNATHVQLVAGPPAVLEMSADQLLLKADGTSTSTISVVVHDAFTHPLPGITINLKTNLGTITSPIVTAEDGKATALLTAGTSPGTVNVLITVGSVTGTGGDVAGTVTITLVEAVRKLYLPYALK